MSPKLQVPRTGSVGATLRAAIEHRLEKTSAAARDLAKPDAVHDFRKGIKRLRALFRLLEPSVGKPAHELRATTGHLARELAATRDIQAARDALDDLTHANLLAVSTASRLRDQLASPPLEPETAVARDGLSMRLATGLDEAASAIAGWPLDELTFADIADGLARTYKRGRQARPDDWADADAATLHRLRRRVIEHRYQMVLVKPLWPKIGTAWVAEAQHLRDDLGAHHDLAELAALTSAGKPLERWHKQIAPLISQRQADHAAAAAQRSARLYAEKPYAFRHRVTALWAAESAGDKGHGKARPSRRS